MGNDDVEGTPGGDDIVVFPSPRWFCMTAWTWVNRLTGTEMAEGGLRAMPHCCTQARCWMHVDDAWCDCACRWCRVARGIGRSTGTASTAL